MIKDSDLEKQAEELIKAGKMPKLEDLLAAVGDSRQKYADKIVAARNENHAGAAALKG
jgi:hypothetical protein